MTADIVQATIVSLQDIKEDRKKWESKESKEISKKSDIPWKIKDSEIKSLKFFYNPKKTQQNLKLIDALIDEIQKPEFKDIDVDEIARKRFIAILRTKHNELSKGQTSELLAAIIDDVKSLDFNNRPSSLISEDSAQISLLNQKVNIKFLLKKKKLPLDIFESEVPKDIGFSNDVKWAFDHIYKYPYPQHNLQYDVARAIHGIQHVTRSAIYGKVFANLYKKYGDKEANNLTKEDVELIQIAILFHDAAREGEGVDKWDQESALFLYYYLTRVRKFDQQTAKLVSEAVANKDPNENGFYFSITENETGVYWHWKKNAPVNKNIYQKIIHDADCLDIIRARAVYDGEHLDIKKQFGHEPSAFNEIAHLITEARSLIEFQGDSFNRINPEKKKQYETITAYDEIMKSIDDQHLKFNHTMLKSLSEEFLVNANRSFIDTTEYNPSAPLDQTNLNAAIREGIVFSRGIADPSAIAKKRLKNAKFGTKEETLAALEIRKTYRRRGIATSSLKQDKTEKEGNPARSVGILGYGSSTFTNAGFLIINKDVDSIKAVAETDVGTGRGKKATHKRNLSPLSKQKKQDQLTKLRQKLKMGGSTVRFKGLDFDASHVEISYDVASFDAIYFSQDPNLYNVDAHQSAEALHRHSPLLQALFLRNEYFRQTKINLPIVEYSGLHNFSRIIPESELLEENIIEMWVQMCSDFIKDKLADPHSDEIFKYTVDEIKTLSMYSTFSNNYAERNASADSNYSDEFKAEINAAILQEKQRLIDELVNKIKYNVHENPNLIFSQPIFFSIIRNPVLIDICKHEIQKAIHDTLKDKDIFALTPHDTIWIDKKSLSEDVSFLTSFSILSTFTIDDHGISFIDKNDARRHKAQHILYKSNMSKTFTLSKLINDEISLQLIKEQALNHAINKIEQLKHKDRNTNVIAIEEWAVLICYIKHFDVLENSQIQKNLRNPINQILEIFLASNNFLDHREFTQLLVLLDKANLLKEHQNTLIKIVNQLDKSLNEDDTSLRNYLRVSSIASIPQDTINNKIDKWLNQYSFGIRVLKDGLTFNGDIIDYYQTHQSDLNLFRILIDHVALTENPMLDPRYLDFSCWLNTILFIERDLDGKTFNSKQVEIIQDKLNRICNAWINTNDYSYDSAQKIVNQLNNLTISLTPPDVLLHPLRTSKKTS